MLQEQQQQLQGLLGALQDTLKVVTTKLDESAAGTRKAMADQTLATTNIGDNVRILREKTDETNVRISTMVQELESMRQTIASQPAPQAVAAAPAGTDPALTAQAPATPPVSVTPPPGASPQRMYQTSLDDYMAGRYELAIQGFEGFIQMYRTAPQAGAAMYNVGMSYFNQRPPKWAEAREAFLKVINDFPQAPGSAVPDAYFKLGQVYEALNQPENAKKAYEAAIQKFPGPASALSSQALSRLNTRR
jgi:TolA-binding protein